MSDYSEISKRNIAALKDPDAVLSAINDEIQKSENLLKPWKIKIVKWYELYKMYQREKHYEGLAHIFVPETLRAVETVVGNLYKAIVGQDQNWFEYEGKEEADEGAALAMTQLVRAQMEENKFKSRLMDSLRQMAITGLTVRKIGWDFEQVPRKRNVLDKQDVKDPLSGKPKTSKKFKRGEFALETVRDHWTFEPVDLLAFHISDINVPYNDLQKARWIAEQYLVDRQWIKERVKKGWLSGDNLDKLDEAAQDAKQSDSKTFTENRSQTSGFAVHSYGQVKKIEIIERWGLVRADWVYSSEELNAMKLDGDDMVEAVVVVANRKVILKLEANPFWHGQKPYVSCPYVPVEYEFDGIGVAQIGEKLQEELNDSRNQIMDNKTLILMNMWLRSRSSGIKSSELRVRPLGVINTNDMNGLKPLQPPVLTGTGVAIESVIKEDFRQSVGAASNLQGIAQSGVDTATESSIINKESFGRLLLTAELYGELILKPTLTFAEYLNYQFFDHIKTIKLIGAVGVKFRKLSPEELTGFKDVNIKLATDVADNPTAQRQQLLQFLTIVQQMPPQVMQYHWKLLDKLYKSFFPGRTLEDVYDAPPQDENMLSPEEEVDLVLAEYPVQAKPLPDGNYQQHIAVLEQEFHKYKFGLSPVSFEIFKNLIMQYEALKEQDLIQRQAQMKMQMMAAAQNGGGGNGKNAKNAQAQMMGQMPNGNAFTQTGNPELPQQDVGA